MIIAKGYSTVLTKNREKSWIREHFPEELAEAFIETLKSGDINIGVKFMKANYPLYDINPNKEEYLSAFVFGPVDDKGNRVSETLLVYYSFEHEIKVKDSPYENFDQKIEKVQKWLNGKTIYMNRERYEQFTVYNQTKTMLKKLNENNL